MVNTIPALTILRADQMSAAETTDEDPEAKQETFNYKVINEAEVTDNFLDVDGIKLPEGKLDEDKIEKLYRRDPIVHRAIEKEIEDLFGLRPRIKSDSENLKEVVEDLLFSKKVNLYKNFKEATKGAYLNSMALIYLNYDNSEDIETEPDVVEEVTQSGVIYKKDVEDYNLDKDLTSDTFNEVKSWELSIGGGDVKSDERNIRTEVHSSRLIHVVYDTVFNDPWVSLRWSRSSIPTYSERSWWNPPFWPTIRTVPGSGLSLFPKTPQARNGPFWRRT